MTAFIDRRRRADRAELADALDAERVERARHRGVELGAKAGAAVGTRHGVVHEAAGDELAALGVVDHLLAQRLADALHRAALDLPATIIGLTTRPMSLTDAYETTSTSPVSGSISTSQTWQPFGQVGAAGGRSPLRDGCARSGCLPASANRSMPRSVPTTEKRPARYSMSAGATSSASPASVRAAVDGLLGGDLHRRAAGEERARAGAAEAVAAVGVALDDADPARSARRRRRPRAARSWSRCPGPSPASPRRSRSCRRA